LTNIGGSATLSGVSASGPPAPPRGPLPQEEFHRIFSRVPRLTVEVVIATADRGVLLALREFGPCQGLWHLPGGTVRFGEPAIAAVRRVARDELGVAVDVGALLGYIEYPSHYENGLDSPVGLAFRAGVAGGMPEVGALRSQCAWFPVLPANMHEEQISFLADRLGLARRA
jgi:ADP-ribose pyrophosphatase YjhB (NUDIX family)